MDIFRIVGITIVPPCGNSLSPHGWGWRRYPKTQVPSFCIHGGSTAGDQGCLSVYPHHFTKVVVLAAIHQHVIVLSLCTPVMGLIRGENSPPFCLDWTARVQLWFPSQISSFTDYLWAPTTRYLKRSLEVPRNTKTQNSEISLQSTSSREDTFH